MAVVDVTVVPIGTSTTSLGDFVAGCQLELQEHGEDLRFELTAMGTIIEGDLDRILAVIRRLHEVPFKKGARRVSTIIRIDDRRDKAGSIAQKVKSVEAQLTGID